MSSIVIIDDYLSRVLALQLRRAGLPDGPTVDGILADVNARIRAILSRWSDHRFRSVLLLPCLEEAAHYQPADAPLLVRAFVVAAIRNSRIEDFHSGPELVSQADVRSISEEAVVFFESRVTETFAGIAPDASNDPFAGLLEEYSATARALTALFHMKGRTSVYEPVPAQIPALPEETAPIAGGRAMIKSVVTSGMDASFDPELVASLHQLARSDPGVFFSPSFKHVTRHPRKLFTILEWLLGHGKEFVSPNYHITNGYVAARAKPLQPITYTSDLRHVLRHRAGLSKRHADALRDIERNVE